MFVCFIGVKRSTRTEHELNYIKIDELKCTNFECVNAIHFFAQNDLNLMRDVFLYVCVYMKVCLLQRDSISILFCLYKFRLYRSCSIIFFVFINQIRSLADQFHCFYFTFWLNKFVFINFFRKQSKVYLIFCGAYRDKYIILE